MPDVAVVITTINPPNRAMVTLARGCVDHGFRFVAVGDTKGPSAFELQGCSFHDVQSQRDAGFRLSALCPTRSYTRKNLGYLLAMRGGASVLIETDDDNAPRPAFFAPRERVGNFRSLVGGGWVNVYRYFSDETIWPRGLPLDRVHHLPFPMEGLSVLSLDCPIQQGLADENPDVDALYRLILPLPQSFRAGESVALGRGSMCPFNSQNTTWWRDAFPLMYLPAFCSFRMTDIWRSFVAQRIAWENDWSLLFHGATVVQDRNEHDLMRDFADEVPGYLHNQEIGRVLLGLDLARGMEHIPRNMRLCYEALVRCGVMQQEEFPLLDAWLDDIDMLRTRTTVQP